METELARQSDSPFSALCSPLQTVIVVSPDAVQREAVSRPLRKRGMAVHMFRGFEECLEELRASAQRLHVCVVCPLSSGGKSGLEFQHQLRQLPHAVSVVFRDAPLAMSEVVEAMRQDAVAVVEPSDDLGPLMSYIDEGLERSRAQFVHEQQCHDTLERLGSLNLGEHQVLQGIMVGKLNKEIARQLKLSTRTIEQRRRELFRKMDVEHPALLVRKVIEAVQTPLLQTGLDERGKWLEAVRHDFAHPLLRRPADFVAAPWQLIDSGSRVADAEARATRG